MILILKKLKDVIKNMFSLCLCMKKQKNKIKIEYIIWKYHIYYTEKKEATGIGGDDPICP